jgi:hypothetical protein
LVLTDTSLGLKRNVDNERITQMVEVGEGKEHIESAHERLTFSMVRTMREVKTAAPNICYI